MGACAVGVAALTTVLLPGLPAEATFPGANGAITFQRPDDNGTLQVWVANPDMSGQTQLTHGAADSGWPTWSPGGDRIAFDSSRTDPDPNDEDVRNDVFTMNPDGSDVVRVTNFAGLSGDASWFPDGSRLVFESDLGADPGKLSIYSSRPDGSDLRRITTLPAGAEADSAARVSPDGLRLVFTRAFSDGATALYVVDLDGSHEHRLDATAILHPGDADWSPDGRTLVFEADGAARGSHGNIYTIGADGTHVRNLTMNPPGRRGSADPVFSPDGQQILFVLGLFPLRGDPTIGLATMRPDGTDRSYLSDTPTFEDQPDWESLR